MDVLEEMFRPVSVQAFEPDPVYDGPLPSSLDAVRRMSDRDDGASGWVYVFTAQALQQVLYVGMSLTPAARFEKHRQLKPWFLLADWYTLVRLNAEDRAEARAVARYVEAVTIRHFAPWGNRAGLAR